MFIKLQNKKTIKFIPLYKTNLSHFYPIFLINQPNEKTYVGFLRKKGDFSNLTTDQKKEKLKNNNTFFQRKQRIDGELRNYFLKILQLAKEKNINIIFIKYPYPKEVEEIMIKNKVNNEYYYMHLFQ